MESLLDDELNTNEIKKKLNSYAKQLYTPVRKKNYEQINKLLNHLESTRAKSYLK